VRVVDAEDSRPAALGRRNPHYGLQGRRAGSAPTGEPVQGQASIVNGAVMYLVLGSHGNRAPGPWPDVGGLYDCRTRRCFDRLCRGLCWNGRRRGRKAKGGTRLRRCRAVRARDAGLQILDVFDVKVGQWRWSVVEVKSVRALPSAQGKKGKR
jgi:hypothetical protein